MNTILCSSITKPEKIEYVVLSPFHTIKIETAATVHKDLSGLSWERMGL